MAREKTFVMLKPDCLKRGLVGNIIQRVEDKGWRIIEAKTMRLEPGFLYDFYDHIKEQPYFLEVFNYMLSGQVLGLIIEGEGVVVGMRRMMGPPIIENAAPGTIRGDLAVSSANSLIHASKSDEHVRKESELFFRV